MQEKKIEATMEKFFFRRENIIEDAPEERAHKGIFLSFQYPVEIPGVTGRLISSKALNENQKSKWF